MGRLNNRVAIITGAARGIGLAIAKRFIEEGANVVLSDIDEIGGATAAKHLGAKALFVRCDVGNSSEVQNLVETANKTHGSVDILVNNAGIVSGADFLELKESEFDRVLRVNLKGSFLAAQAAAKKMVAQVKAGKKPGCIINMSSINATVAIPNHTAYCASKGGIQQLTRSMALALAPYGIRVNAIGPGSIMTEMMTAVAKDQEAKRGLLARTPLGRIGEADEVAAVAAFLASDDASYITGETIHPDGGRLVLNYTVPVKDEQLR